LSKEKTEFCLKNITDLLASSIKITTKVSTTPFLYRQKGIKDPCQRKQHEDKLQEKLKMSSKKRSDDFNTKRMLFSQSTQSQNSAQKHDSQLGLQRETDNLWITPNISTFNSFGYLGADGATQEEEMKDVESNGETSTAADDMNKTKTKLKIKTKPIYIKAKTYSDVQTAMKSMKISKYGIKIINGGIKLMVDAVDDFKSAKKFFTDSKIEFYTYELADEKTFKVVLYGLPAFDCEEVQEFLQEVNVFPKEVKRMKTKTESNDSAIYLVSFASGTTNITELKKVRFVNYIKVTWSHYIRRGNITQCRRCQQFSHGTRNCNIQPKCVKCGEGHLSEQCPNDEIIKADQRALKCANCGEKHAANFSECSVRLNYIQYREQLVEKERARKFLNGGGIHSPAGPFINKYRGSYKPAPPPSHNAWSSNGQNLAAKMENNNNTNSRLNSYTTNNTNNNNNNSNLYSPMEIMKITNDIFSKLSSCKSKADQINVIIGIVSKYVYNFDG
jgi:hypothetical protein